MLVARLRVDPRGSAVNVQRTAVEDFREAGAHMHFGCGRQAIRDRSRRCVATPMGTLGRHWWRIVQQIRLLAVGWWRLVVGWHWFAIVAVTEAARS